MSKISSKEERILVGLDNINHSLHNIKTSIDGVSGRMDCIEKTIANKPPVEFTKDGKNTDKFMFGILVSVILGFIGIISGVWLK